MSSGADVGLLTAVSGEDRVDGVIKGTANVGVVGDGAHQGHATGVGRIDAVLDQPGGHAAGQVAGAAPDVEHPVAGPGPAEPGESGVDAAPAAAE